MLRFGHVARLFLFVFLFLATHSYLVAQSTQGTITGLITDADGAALSDSTVVVTNRDTGVAIRTKTNNDGRYNVPALNVGTYSVSIEHGGFRRWLQEGLNLSTSQVLEVSGKLQNGSVDQSVTVTEHGATLETSTSSIGQTIEARSVAELPLGNRTSMNIVGLTGGAVFIDSSNYSLSGGRSKSGMTWLDGGSGQNIRIGNGSYEVSPPADAVQEIGVISNNYAAEFGGSASGIIIQNTKAGTNGFHGTAYEFIRNDAFDASGYFATTKPKLRYNVFGGTIGGPIVRNKTFFFFSYEGTRQKTGSTTTLTVPTVSQRGGDFSQTYDSTGKLIPIYDPQTTTTSGGVTTRSRFANNIVPQSRIDPVAAAVLNYYPLPNRTPDNVSGANNYRANDLLTNNTDFYLGRVDHNLTANDRLVLRYIFTRGATDNASVYPLRGADPTTNSTSNDHIGYAQWAHTFSSTVVNDLRFLYDVRTYHQFADGVGGDYPAQLGLTGVSSNAFPNFAPAGFSPLGSTSQERRQYPIHVIQLVDNLSQVIGRHSLKYGFEARRSEDEESSLSTASGAFTFATQPTGLPSSAATGNGLASLILGFPTAFAAASTQQLDRHSYYWAAFVQDDWTVAPKLTLNLGLRWETDTPIVDVNNRMNSFDPNAINPVSGTPGVIKFLGVNGYRNTPYNGDYNNFGPRFGFAWQPFSPGSTVIRGGVGVFFAHPFDSAQPNAAAIGYSTSQSLTTPDNGITAPFYLRNGVPAPTSSVVLDDSYGAVPVGSAATTAVNYYALNKKSGYMTQFNVNVQRQLPASFILDVSGIGNVAHKLAGATQNINQISPTVLGVGHSSQKDRPFPQFGTVSVVVPTNSDSNYYAGMVRISCRFQNGFNINTTYTYAKFLNNSFEGGSSFGSDGGAYSNYYDRASDYGPSSNDIRHQLVFSALYELQWGPGRRYLSTGVLGHVVGGWTVGNVTRAYSGAPFTVATNTNNTNAFSSGSQRANIVGNPYLSESARGPKQLWLNSASFAQPATYSFGTQRRNSLRGPGFASLDFSLIRSFRFGEGRVFQLRGEATNALNHTNLTTPAASYGAASFGYITSAYSPRQLQVGGRFVF
jgi:hypothetical protein